MMAMDDDANATTLGNVQYDALFDFAMRDLEIEEELKENMQSLLESRDHHQREIAPIQVEWKAIAERSGKAAADRWLHEQPMKAEKLQNLLKMSRDIDAQIELELAKAAEKKKKIEEEIGKARSLLSTLLEQVPNVKISYLHPERNVRRMNGFRHLSSFRALQESIKELFPTCTYELMWNSNVVDSEDAFIITLEEHIKKAGKEKEYDISTLVLELDALEEMDDIDMEDENNSGDSSSSDNDNPRRVQRRTGKWTVAEKVRLREGLRRFKSDYKKVATIVGSRDNKQVSNFLSTHPKFIPLKKQSVKTKKRMLMMETNNNVNASKEHASNIANWLDNSSVVANRLTNTQVLHSEVVDDDDREAAADAQVDDDDQESEL